MADISLYLYHVNHASRDYWGCLLARIIFCDNKPCGVDVGRVAGRANRKRMARNRMEMRKSKNNQIQPETEGKEEKLQKPIFSKNILSMTLSQNIRRFIEIMNQPNEIEANVKEKKKMIGKRREYLRVVKNLCVPECGYRTVREC